MTTETATSLRDSLAAIVGQDRVLDRPVDLIAFASDASFYRLIPKAVAFAGSIEDVQALFRLSHERQVPMTFRAAGTSLSGQSVSDGILVEVARDWRGIKVLEGGAKVKVPTVDGAVMMSVAPGSSSGRTLRIKGRGMTRKDGSRGDQFVTLEISLPEADADLAARLEGWQDTRDLRGKFGA